MPIPFKIVVRSGFYCYTLRGNPEYMPNLQSIVQIMIEGMNAPTPTFGLLFADTMIRSEEIYRLY